MRSRSRTLVLLTTATTTTVAAVLTVALALGAGLGACSSSSGDDDTSDAAGDAMPFDALTPVAETGVAVDASTTDSAPDPPTPSQILASNLGDLLGVTATETTIYVTQGTSQILTIPIDGVAGGAAPAFIDVGAGNHAGTITIVAGALYWIDTITGSIGITQLADPAATAIVVPAAPVHAVAFGETPTTNTLLFAGSTAAEADAGDAGDAGLSGPNTGDIEQIVSPTTTATVLIPMRMNPSGVAASATRFFWTEPLRGDGVVLTATFVDPSTATTLATAQTRCGSIAADSQGVYWADQSSIQIVTDPDADPPHSTTLAGSEVNPFSLVADTGGVYWLTSNGNLRRSNRSSSMPTTMAPPFTAPTHANIAAVALTSMYVVWLTGDGQVLRHSKL